MRRSLQIQDEREDEEATLWYVAGAFPCLRAHFHLERRLRAYILTTYLPSFLVVLLSWLSFWIDLESAPARTSLSILTILTITTQSSGLLRSMPAGSFTKAIDVWMATCLVFVFGAFIEYSIVNTLARRQKAKTVRDGSSAIAGLLSATATAALPLQPVASSSAALNAFGARTQRVIYHHITRTALSHSVERTPPPRLTQLSLLNKHLVTHILPCIQYGGVTVTRIPTPNRNVI